MRVPTANEGDIQKATDAGALGIIIPMVDSVEEARNAVLFSKFPIGHRDNPNTKPWGHRSSGQMQAPSLWGPGYAVNANNNVLVMILIENPKGVGIIDDILEEVPGHRHRHGGEQRLRPCTAAIATATRATTRARSSCAKPSSSAA